MNFAKLASTSILAVGLIGAASGNALAQKKYDTGASDAIQWSGVCYGAVGKSIEGYVKEFCSAVGLHWISGTVLSNASRVDTVFTQSVPTGSRSEVQSIREGVDTACFARFGGQRAFRPSRNRSALRARPLAFEASGLS